MAIVRMKRVHLLALERDRSKILETFQRLGCVQIEPQAQKLADESWAGLLKKPESMLTEARASRTVISSALETLHRYAPGGPSMIKKLFTARPELTMTELQNGAFLSEMLEAAGEINSRAKKISDLVSEQSRLENKLASLLPWKELDVALDTSSTQSYSLVLGTCPATASMEELKKVMEEVSPLCEVYPVSSDTDQSYLYVIFYPLAEEETFGALKSFGFSRMAFKDITGTVTQNITTIRERLSELAEEKQSCEKGVADFAPRRADLEQALDALSVRVQREEAAERLITGGKFFYLEGWTPEAACPALEKMFSNVDCAFEFLSPEPGEEDVPILLKGNRFTEPFNMVTEMYALPKYTNIDPNPIYSVFYALFFGMMFADVAYGLILMVLGWLITKKSKPKGTMGYAFKLMQICGVTSIAFGFVFGGFFSDAISVVGRTFFNIPDKVVIVNGVEQTIAGWGIRALWVEPLQDPMTVLIFALALGVVQIIVGMAVKGFLLIRDGQPLDAVLQIVPWWLFFASIAVFAVSGSAVWILAGLGLIILTQGYKKKGLVGKLFGGVVALYDITAYLSDLLSYSRLMALGLAGGVIGSVFNQLGAMPGSIPVVGVLIFLVIFVFGHTFNLVVNIIGTFVHAARLQYVEFFAKFYEAGGVAFTPLSARTKYVDVVEKIK